MGSARGKEELDRRRIMGTRKWMGLETS